MTGGVAVGILLAALVGVAIGAWVATRGGDRRAQEREIAARQWVASDDGVVRRARAAAITDVVSRSLAESIRRWIPGATDAQVVRVTAELARRCDDAVRSAEAVAAAERLVRR
jgi:hypothetical protein